MIAVRVVNERRRKLPIQLSLIELGEDILNEALFAAKAGDKLGVTLNLHEFGALACVASVTKVPRKARATFNKKFRRLFVKAWEIGGPEFEKDFGTPSGIELRLQSE